MVAEVEPQPATNSWPTGYFRTSRIEAGRTTADGRRKDEHNRARGSGTTIGIYWASIVLPLSQNSWATVWSSSPQLPGRRGSKSGQLATGSVASWH